jgi:hypothetical protein
MAARRNTRQEWAIAIFGGLALAAGLVWLLRGGGGGGELAGEIPIVTSAAPPVATPSVAAPPAPATVSLPGDLALAGLRTGPDGGMAIVVAGGRQYLLRPGRTLPGGLRLLRVESGRAILGGPAGEQVLAFPDAGRTQAAAPAPPGGDPTPWRLALAPQRGAQGLDGWRLISMAGLPLLARAGLRTGDVLLAANGADLITEEKIMELPQELAANGQLLLRVRRDGQVTEIMVKP